MKTGQSRMVALRLRVRELLGCDDGRQERRDREIGNREAAADQVAVGLQVGREALTRETRLAPRAFDARPVDSEVRCDLATHQGVHRASDQATRGVEVGREGAQEQPRVGEHVLQHQQTQIRPELLIEEVLDLERPPGVGRVGGIQGRTRIPALEGVDDEVESPRICPSSSRTGNVRPAPRLCAILA